MRKKILTYILIFLLITSLTLFFVDYGEEEDRGLSDSPWSCFKGNAQHTGRSPYDTSEVDGTQSWTLSLGGELGSPVIGSDRSIYIKSTDGNLYAVNPDGTKKWSFSTDSYAESSPVISNDGTIYLSSKGGNLYAVNPDGSRRWKKQFNTTFYFSPVIGANGTIYIGGEDGNIYALNSEGEEVWRNSNPGFNSGIFSPPTVAKDGTVYAVHYTTTCFGDSSGSLLAIDENGNTEWGAQFDPSTIPVVSRDVIYFGSMNDHIYSVYPNGTEKWNFAIGEDIGSSPAVGGDGTIYVGTERGNLYAVNSDGSAEWNVSVGEGGISSPVVGSDGSVYIGSDNNKFYAIEPDGDKRWTFSTEGTIDSPPAIGPNNIFLASDDGTLYAFGGVGEKVTDEGSEGDFFTSYRWLLLAAAIVTIIAVISMVMWRKKGSERNQTSERGGGKEDKEEKVGFKSKYDEIE